MTALVPGQARGAVDHGAGRGLPLAIVVRLPGARGAAIGVDDELSGLDIEIEAQGGLVVVLAIVVVVVIVVIVIVIVIMVIVAAGAADRVTVLELVAAGRHHVPVAEAVGARRAEGDLVGARRGELSGGDAIGDRAERQLDADVVRVARQGRAVVVGVSVVLAIVHASEEQRTRDREGDEVRLHGATISSRAEGGPLRTLAGGMHLVGAKEIIMLLTIAAVLAILWLLGFTAFHVTTGALHIIIVVAVIVAIVHFVQARGRAPKA